MREHGLSNPRPPGTASRDDRCQRDRPLAFERTSDSPRHLKHAWLLFHTRGNKPGLHKHIEDAAAHPLALHGNLFREFDLHHSWTPRINDVERGAPYISLAAPAANGAADLAATLYEHLRSHLARHRAFAPDDSSNRRRLARLHMLDEFFVQILHAIASRIIRRGVCGDGMGGGLYGRPRPCLPCSNLGEHGHTQAGRAAIKAPTRPI